MEVKPIIDLEYSNITGLCLRTWHESFQFNDFQLITPKCQILEFSVMSSGNKFDANGDIRVTKEPNGAYYQGLSYDNAADVINAWLNNEYKEIVVEKSSPKIITPKIIERNKLFGSW